MPGTGTPYNDVVMEGSCSAKCMRLGNHEPNVFTTHRIITISPSLNFASLQIILHSIPCIRILTPYPSLDLLFSPRHRSYLTSSFSCKRSPLHKPIHTSPCITLASSEGRGIRMFLFIVFVQKYQHYGLIIPSSLPPPSTHLPSSTPTAPLPHPPTQRSNAYPP